jgi:hypothetical protein
MIGYMIVGMAETGVVRGRLLGGWRGFYMEVPFLLLGKYH